MLVDLLRALESEACVEPVSDSGGSGALAYVDERRSVEELSGIEDVINLLVLQQSVGVPGTIVEDDDEE